MFEGDGQRSGPARENRHRRTSAGELGCHLAKSWSSLHAPQCRAACAGRSSPPSGWRLPAHFTSSASVARPCCSISRPWAASSAFDRLARSSKNVAASQPANTPRSRRCSPVGREGVRGCDQSTRETPVLRLDKVTTAAGLARPPISHPTPQMDGVWHVASLRILWPLPPAACSARGGSA